MNNKKRIKRDIIDNTTDGITMCDILNSEMPRTDMLDISTGYFNIPGYGLLKDALDDLVQKRDGRMRLLLGKPVLIPDATFEQVAEADGERVAEADDEQDDAISLKSDLGKSELILDVMSDTASLIRLLNIENVQVRLGKSRFNHSKCYIFDDDSVYIGSSNFTNSGLTTNNELNAGLYSPAVSEKTRAWFDRMWAESEDAKQELIEQLESSKFGIPAPPYKIYIKMIFERYRDLLASDEDNKHQYSIDLAKFQKGAVHIAMLVLSEFQGVIIADATGLGKTNMGMEILRQKILKENRKALLVAPSQVLKSMWDKKLKESGISVYKQITMESLGRENALDNWYEYKNIDFVLIDESQNFRSKNANRSRNLAKIMTIGKSKQALLLSATPINNSIMDLYYQVSIITRHDDSYFWRTLGIPDLYKHMRDAANKEGGLAAGLEKIQRLLDGIMIRRTRSYIQEVYPHDVISGNTIKFPKHEYSPIHYSLSKLYGNIFQKMLEDVNRLTMAPYGLEQYNIEATEDEKAKYRVLSHLQAILLLKMFESSVEAVKTGLKNKIRLYEYITKITGRGKMIKVRDLNKIITKGNHLMNRTDTRDDGTDGDFDMDEFLFEQLQSLETEEMGRHYDMKRFKNDMKSDLDILYELQDEIRKVTVDKKLEAIRDVILNENALKSESGKILIFTEYVTTARYLLHKLKEIFPDSTVECITGQTKPDTRSKYIERFAPAANLTDGQEIDDDDDSIDILISTEVLAEGQNLQDCNYVINYDLPWNPMRIVQRIGRVDRLGSKHDIIHSRACYPDKDLDAILKLMGKLLDKINVVNTVIGLGEELLGETPNPKQYNGHLKEHLRVLGEKKGAAASDVIRQMERDSDLMPQNTPFNEISKYAKKIGVDELRDMSIGRRSGKVGDKKECVLAYVRTKPERRVYFVVYNYEKDEAYVPENEYDAVNKARCIPDEPNYLPMDSDGDDGNDVGHQKSFEELIRIDKKAREAIAYSDDIVRQYVKKPKSTGFEKARTTLMRILTAAYKSGKIDSESAGRIGDILSRKELQPWDTELHDIVYRYERDGDTNTLIKDIDRIGKLMGIKEEVTEDADTKIDYDKMKLVGAMFITPQKDKHAKGLDQHM